MTKSVASIVYVSCSKGNCIDVLSLDRATGELAHIGFAELSGNGMPLAIGPDQRFLYASVFGDPDGAKQPRYETFAIDSVTGILRHTATLPAVARMSYITVDRGGTFLLGASVAGSVISSHAIDNNGVLQSEPIDVRQVPSKAHHISTDLTNRFAFVPNLGGDIVQQLQFDAANGTFADNSPSRAVLPDGAAPRHMAHHPDGRIVYLLNECAGTLVVYQLDGEAGTLSAIQTSDILPSGFEGTPWGAQIHVSADGRFLFTSERTSSVLAVHSIDSGSGRLTKCSTCVTESCPRGFDVCPSGNWLVAAGEASGLVSSYRIDPMSGDLMKCSTIESGEGPNWVEILRRA